MNWLSGPFMDWSKTFYGGYWIGFGVLVVVFLVPALFIAFHEPKKRP